jgi:hypothetical protein
MIGAMAPLVLFAGPSHATAVAAQHIVEDVMLVAAAVVVASTWAGARIAAHPRSIWSTLVTMAPRKVVASRGGAPGVPVRARGAGDYRS